MKSSAGSCSARIAQLRLLRCLLFESTKSTDIDSPDFDEAFSRYDVIIGPTTPTPAFKIGRANRRSADDVFERYLHDPGQLGRHACDQRTVRIADGLPVGLQIIGKAFDESTVLRAAHAFEQHTDHHKQRPQL